MNTVRTQPKKNILGYVLSFIIVGVMIFLLSKNVWDIAPLLDFSAVNDVAAFSFLIVIGITILLGIPHVFKYLYSASDLDLLFSMPIPTRNIFWLKYIENYLGAPLLSFCLLFFPMISYGISSKAHPFFYFIVFITLLSITMIGLSIAYLVNLIIIQMIPANRANELMTVVSILSGILIYLIFFLPQMNNDFTTEDLFNQFPTLPAWTPMSWAGKALSFSAQGSFKWMGPLSLLIIFTLLIMGIASTLAEKGFRTGYIRLSEGSQKKPKRRKHKAKTVKIQNPILSVGKKEWLTVKRDLREWFSFLPVVFFIIFGVIGFISGGGDLSSLQSFKEITWPIAQGILLFIVALANGPMAASSIGREGKNLWLLQVAPLKGRQIVLGKLLMSWIISFVLIAVIEIVAFFFFKWSFTQLISALLLQGVISLGISSLGLWIGTIGGKYHSTNPQSRLTFSASILLFILGYIYLMIISVPIIFLYIPVELIELPMIEVTGFFTFLGSMIISLLKLKLSYPLLMNILTIVFFLLLVGGIILLFIRLSAQKIDKDLTIQIVGEESPLTQNKK